MTDFPDSVIVENNDNAVHAVVPPRTKLETEIHKSRVIIQRFIKSLSKGLPLSNAEVAQLSLVIRFCSKLGHNAKPFIEKYTLSKSLRYLLRSSQILPHFVPPQIEMVINAWNRNEYNLGPQTNNAVSNDSETNSNGQDSNVESDEEPVIDIRGSAMRGIIISRSTAGRITYTLNKSFQRPAGVFGHNGLKIGSWWPMQICALRDGAHGSRMGGIAGKRGAGAYSIIISGGSDYEDRDLGDIVWYTGSGERGADQILGTGNQALVTSFNKGLPVRVIRGSRSESDFAPSHGLRYDGLYKVIWYGQLFGRDGHKVWKYKLERLMNQDHIRRDVPTPADLRTLA